MLNPIFKSDFILKKLNNAHLDGYEIYQEYGTSMKVDSKHQKIDTLSRSEDISLCLRVFKDQKIGLSYTTRLDPIALEATVDRAIQVAQIMPADPFARLYPFSSTACQKFDLWDNTSLQQPLLFKIQKAYELEKLCLDYDPKIQTVRGAEISEHCRQRSLFNHEGQSLFDRKIYYTTQLTCKAESQQDSQIGSDFGFSYKLENLDLACVAHSAADQALELLGAKPAPNLRCPAILKNSVVSECLEFLVESFFADNVEKGRSMLQKAWGQAIFSKNINIIHDSLLPQGLGTAAFDAEGVPAMKTTLVQNGVVRQPLCNDYYCRKAHYPLTGGSVRNGLSAPRIGFSNLYLEAGLEKPDQWIQGLKKGVIITEMMGLHTANPITGYFSLGASGILIENGKRAHPIRGFAISGNLLEILSQVTAVGCDLKFFGNVGAPSMLIDQINISGV